MRRSIIHWITVVPAVVCVLGITGSSRAAGGDGAGGIVIWQTILTGVFSIAAALGSVWFKDRLEQRKRFAPHPLPSRPETEPEDEVETDEEGEDVQAAAEMDEEVDVEPAEMAAPLRHKSGSRFWIRPLIVFSGGFAFGLTTRALRPIFEGPTHWESIIALIVLVAVALWLAIFHLRSRGGFWSYELEVLAVWTAWFSGWSVIAGGVWSDLVGVVLIWWLGCAIIGGVITTFGRGRSKKSRQ